MNKFKQTVSWYFVVAGSSSAQLQASDATATGSNAANVEEGVYFVRGQFVRVTAQRDCS